MCHVCNKVYSQAATLSKHLRKRHHFESQSCHSKFRYKLDTDGFYRLQTLRYESIELVEQLTKSTIQPLVTNTAHNHYPQQSTEVLMISHDQKEFSTSVQSSSASRDSQHPHPSTDQPSPASSSLDFSLTTAEVCSRAQDNRNHLNELSSDPNGQKAKDDGESDDWPLITNDEPFVPIENQIDFKAIKTKTCNSGEPVTMSSIEHLHQEHHQRVNSSSAEFDLEAFLNSNFQFKANATTTTSSFTSLSASSVTSSAAYFNADDSNLLKCFFLEKLLNEPPSNAAANTSLAINLNSSFNTLD
jgi:hypothetical protein